MDSDDEKDVRYNTTSNINLTSHMNAPNEQLLIKAVGSLLLTTLEEDLEDGKTIPVKSPLYYFSEEKYIAENPDDYDDDRLEILRAVPSEDDISAFLGALYEYGGFSPECCVICLIYINRLSKVTDMPVLPSSWRPLILVSVMIAQKMWDDKFLSNADFSTIYPFFNTHQINELEMKFLELLEYNTTIKYSIYFNYYINLKHLLPEELPKDPMDIFAMAKLEKNSKEFESNMKAKAKTGINDRQVGQGTKVVIS